MKNAIKEVKTLKELTDLSVRHSKSATRSNMVASKANFNTAMSLFEHLNIKDPSIFDSEKLVGEQLTIVVDTLKGADMGLNSKQSVFKDMSYIVKMGVAFKDGYIGLIEHIKGNDINNYADLKKLLKTPAKPKTELELILDLASKLEIEGSDNMDTLLKLIVCIKENAQTIKGDHIKTLQVQLKNAKAIKVA